MNQIFQKVVSSYLNKFIDNFKDLNISVTGGELYFARISINIHEINAQLRSVFENVIISRLELEHLRINIPYSSLNSKSVEVSTKKIKAFLLISKNEASLSVDSTKHYQFQEIEANVQSLFNRLVQQIVANVVVHIDELEISLVSPMRSHTILLHCKDMSFHAIDVNGAYSFIDASQNPMKLLTIGSFVVIFRDEVTQKSKSLIQIPKMELRVQQDDNGLNIDIGIGEILKLILPVNDLLAIGKMLEEIVMIKKVDRRQILFMYTKLDSSQLAKRSLTIGIKLQTLLIDILFPDLPDGQLNLGIHGVDGLYSLREIIQEKYKRHIELHFETLAFSVGTEKEVVKLFDRKTNSYFGISSIIPKLPARVLANKFLIFNEIFQETTSCMITRDIYVTDLMLMLDFDKLDRVHMILAEVTGKTLEILANFGGQAQQDRKKSEISNMKQKSLTNLHLSGFCLAYSISSTEGGLCKNLYFHSSNQPPFPLVPSYYGVNLGLMLSIRSKQRDGVVVSTETHVELDHIVIEYSKQINVHLFKTNQSKRRSPACRFVIILSDFPSFDPDGRQI